MYSIEARQRALALVAEGRSLNSVSKQTGISRWALRQWRTRIDPLPRMSGQAEPCGRCSSPPRLPDDVCAYAYLLGLYLGDGCISPQARGGFQFRVACADAWPGLIEACRTAINRVRPRDGVYILQRQGCVMVTSYGRHWPCLFPQHGTGKKHLRPIRLEPWQQGIVQEFPWEFIRGLIHSDGCRSINRTTRPIGGTTKCYEYPRYFFTNLSADILGLFTGALDQVGVEWKRANKHNISVARRASVALMDAHVGPKY
ncbi:transcriptional regulator [Streptomyces sp. NBC_01754]|uniref:transcriptional regulator n=1 Tax=Streptomyces sp. NBC_01754 TaxID=2975930 RepID=UPI002DDC3AFF|nr:transcriptional regulator [Streptomyces sp. NBC_01754]WSC91954.1 transcriptional regulator [Streptomyces sp. NBC_01754]